MQKKKSEEQQDTKQRDLQPEGEASRQGKDTNEIGNLIDDGQDDETEADETGTGSTE